MQTDPSPTPPEPLDGGATRRPGRPATSTTKRGAALITPHDDKYARRFAALWVGSEIRIARERQDISAETLARAIAVSPDTVYAWERGRNAPPLSKLLRIAWALGVSPASLLEQCE